MEISKILSLEVPCVSPDATLREAARIMRDQDIGSLSGLGGRALHDISEPVEGTSNGNFHPRQRR